MTSMTCAGYDARGVPVAYAARTLDAAETESFEINLIGCATCQDAVRLAVGARSALHGPGPRPRPSWRTAILAGIAASLLLVVGGSGWTRRAELRALGDVSGLPRYEGIEVRSSPALADSFFVAGMRAYVEGRQDAARLLAEARAHGADVATTSFFQGVLELHAGRARAAASLLAQSAGIASPYRQEAHFYLAKARLRLGDPDAALDELGRAAMADSRIAAHARALGDSVRRARR
jgi:hypothetical protein